MQIDDGFFQSLVKKSSSAGGASSEGEGSVGESKKNA
jgi:hypothetical protein